MSMTDDNAELRAQIDDLRATIERLEARLTTGQVAPADAIAPISHDEPVDRRGALGALGKLAAGAVAGGVAAVVATADQAAAATTSFSSSTPGPTVSASHSGQNGIALQAVASAFGSTAISASASEAASTGIFASGSSFGALVLAGGSGGIGLNVAGGVCDLKFDTRAAPYGAPPDQRSKPFGHAVGEVVFQLSPPTLWMCVERGLANQVGTWKRFAFVEDLTGAFRPIATARVYDSRRDVGAITVGANRTIDVKDKRDPNTYAVSQANVVPAGATAVAYNITVTGFTLRGNLAVEPGDATAAGGSTINWSPGPLSLANGSVAKLDANRRLKIFAGGQAGATTQFVIDVVGYYT